MDSNLLLGLLALVFASVYAKECVDVGDNCQRFAGLCKSNSYIPILKEFCPKTCNHCPGPCQDRARGCARWKLHGYCESRYYSKFEKETQCAKTCNLCRKDNDDSSDEDGSGRGITGSGDYYDNTRRYRTSVRPTRRYDHDGSGSGEDYVTHWGGHRTRKAHPTKRYDGGSGEDYVTQDGDHGATRRYHGGSGSGHTKDGEHWSKAPPTRRYNGGSGDDYVFGSTLAGDDGSTRRHGSGSGKGYTKSYKGGHKTRKVQGTKRSHGGSSDDYNYVTEDGEHWDSKAPPTTKYDAGSGDAHVYVTEDGEHWDSKAPPTTKYDAGSEDDYVFGSTPAGDDGSTRKPNGGSNDYYVFGSTLGGDDGSTRRPGSGNGHTKSWRSKTRKAHPIKRSVEGSGSGSGEEFDTQFEQETRKPTTKRTDGGDKNQGDWEGARTPKSATKKV